MGWLLTRLLDGMLNSTTWLYGAEVLPIALRSKVMGLAAASHFIVNVAGMSASYGSRKECLPNTLSRISHRGRTQCICQHRRELLLCLCGLYFVLPSHRLLLLPVCYPCNPI